MALIPAESQSPTYVETAMPTLQSYTSQSNTFCKVYGAWTIVALWQKAVISKENCDVVIYV